MEDSPAVALSGGIHGGEGAAITALKLTTFRMPFSLLDKLIDKHKGLEEE